jgi:polysaccharide pyruvyl transferase WcaK-like protein
VIEAGMRVFLYGYYGEGNLGDDLLLRACVTGIRGICADVHFVVRSRHPLDSLVGPVETCSIDRILSDQSRSKPSRLVAAMKAYHAILRDCDWFVFGGGTVFHERNSSQPLILTFLICLLARLLGVRVAALGVGIGELRSTMARWAMGGVVWTSDVFAVRDRAALEQCRRAGVENQVVLTGDLAYLLARQLRPTTVPKPPIGQPDRIGISIYPPALIHQHKRTKTFHAMCGAIAALVQRGCSVRLLAFHCPFDFDAEGDDAQVLEQLAESVAHVANVRPGVTSVPADGAAILSTFESIDLHCGMRYHGHVLAALFGLPFVGVAADNKIDAICELFEMPVMKSETATTDDILTSVDLALTRTLDRETLEGCKHAAEQNFVLLADAIRRRVA